MSELLWFVLKSLVGWVISGVVLYFIDKKIVIPIKLWIYKLGAKGEPRRHSEWTKGVLMGRSTKSKVGLMTAISAAMNFYFMLYFHADIVVEAFLFVFDIPAMFIGFNYIGRGIDTLLLKQDRIYRGLDAIDNGEVSVSGLAGRAKAHAEGLTQDVIGSASSMGGNLWSRWKNWYRPQPPSVSAPMPPVQDPQKPHISVDRESAKDAFDRFVGGKRGS